LEIAREPATVASAFGVNIRTTAAGWPAPLIRPPTSEWRSPGVRAP